MVRPSLTSALTAALVFVAVGCASSPSSEGERPVLSGTEESDAPTGSLPADRLGNRCDEGEPRACTLLGMRLLDGEGRRRPGRAAERLERGCRLGEPTACSQLASALVTGDQLDRDLERARRLYERACRRDGAFGCLGLARMHANGTIGPVDHNRAEALYRRSCRLGDMSGCLWFGRYLLDRGETDRAFVRLARACYGGRDDACTELQSVMGAEPTGASGRAAVASRLDETCGPDRAAACTMLGVHFEKGRGVQQARERAAERYRRACGSDAGGTLRACDRLGALHEHGDGAACNLERAAELYRGACDRGYAVACSHLGSLYERGAGVDRDRSRAADLYRRSCSRGYPRACYKFGHLVETDRGAEGDDFRAAIYYRIGCTSGSPGACNALGIFFDEGKGGLSVRPEDAAELYRRACDRGDDYGCHNYAIALKRGRGVDRAPDRAKAYFEIACRRGVRAACRAIGRPEDAGNAPESGARGADAVRSWRRPARRVR
ncbi:MAG: tetratricopeptide repeat protein [Bradymonadaceae bacterium]